MMTRIVCFFAVMVIMVVPGWAEEYGSDPVVHREGNHAQARFAVAPGSVDIFFASEDGQDLARQIADAVVPLPGTGREGRDPGEDWNNFGGNSERNGLTTVVGPHAAELIWSNTDDYSIIAWQPVTLDNRVFAIRESGFPQSGAANDKLVVYDLNTGEELWSTVVPYAGDPDEEWIAYVGGAHDGTVYCARGGSGRTTPVHAFSAESGTLLWSSVYETVAGPQDGFVFAPDGDILVGDFDNLVRIDSSDGSTAWQTVRGCSVSGNCGCAAGDDFGYIDEPVYGGHVISKVNLATGDILYSSSIMEGFTAQNAPFVSADGQTVYFARSQNSPPYDNLYAFIDNGEMLLERWNRPVRWTTSHEHGLAADGSIYTFLPGDEFVRLDPTDGSVMASAGVLSPIGTNLSAHTAVAADGTVYVSNGWASTPASNGRIWAFTADLSTNLFTLMLDRQNSGGPSLGAQGTLIVADRVGVYAYRTAVPTVGVSLTCTPPSGTLPFPVHIDVTLNNLYDGFARRIRANIDVLTAGGMSITNWKAGTRQLGPGGSFTASFNQMLPNHPMVFGTNTFTLFGVDVTPSPYNQPPYPPSGDTDLDSCTVEGIAP